MLANRAAQPYSPFWHSLRLTQVTARVRYRANKSTLGVALAIVRSHDPARLGVRGRRALEPSQSLCFQLLIITRNLIPRNRGAVAHWLPRFGSAVNNNTIAHEFKGLNQIDSVCASSAKRDFASKLSRLLTAF